nr:uncharacterized protein LOC107428117 [Ziziphus jujuba var. spinosa]
MKHPFHPQHTLTLLERPLLPDDDGSQKKVPHCGACLGEMKNVFVLHCDQCRPSLYLHLACALREPTVKYDRHDHLLVLYDRTNTKLVDASPCAACNTDCDVSLYRCFGCDYNIHSQCLNLPRTVDFDDHVHPFTLVNSLNEDESGMYHCDICEERREANHGLYVCQECPSFVSHFECVLSPSYTDEKDDEPWMRRKDREYRETEKKAEPFDEKAVPQSTVIFSQLGMEIKKIGETVDELLEETHRKEVTEKLEKIQHSHAQAQVMLRQLGELVD